MTKCCFNEFEIDFPSDLDSFNKDGLKDGSSCNRFSKKVSVRSCSMETVSHECSSEKEPDQEHNLEDFPPNACCSEDDLAAEQSNECPVCDEKRECHQPAPVNLSPKELGKKGELAAVVFLERKGWDILETNWCCFAGEADIIALDEDTICFVEVKTRSGAEKGFPEEAVDSKKRERYEKIAACYLQTCNLNFSHVRFDIISIMVLSSKRAFLRLHTNAFGEGM